MNIQSVLDLAIVTVPTAYAAIVAFRFISGLARLGRRDRSNVQVANLPDLTSVPAPQYAVEQVANNFIPNPDGWAEATEEEAALVEAHAAYIAAYWQSYPTWNVVPFHRSVPAVLSDRVVVDWRSMSVNQLRKECSDWGIRWNRANGGKHLSKTGMIRALESVEAVQMVG